MGAFLSTSTILDTSLNLQVKLGNGVLVHVKAQAQAQAQKKRKRSIYVLVEATTPSQFTNNRSADSQSHRKTSRACTQPHRYKHNYNTQQQPPAPGFFFFFYALVSFR
ncbi:hypothetical protein LWI29_007228 [Acer saccharum]|uniref:Uncharacterized protein n=1 Tax=Acer saccharum TaxID=4024 RepID=A0AA39S2Z2_ACESA|nr:hypothetical protein LWI29_007228 [Acer saccharum]